MLERAINTLQYTHTIYTCNIHIDESTKEDNIQ